LARIALTLGCLCAVLASGAAAEAQGAGSGGRPWLHRPFKVHVGDDPSWSAPDLDDRGWPEVDARMLPGTSIPGWSGIAWFRLWLEIPPEAAGRPVPLYGRYVGATEVFVDGARQFALGDPGAVAAGGSTPVDFKAETPIWITFARPGRHLVAVRFASRHVAVVHRVSFPAGFELALGHPTGADRPTGWMSRLLPPAFIGATVALALLHLLLFLFHRHRRENLHYAIAVLGVATMTPIGMALRWATSTTEVILLRAGFSAAIALSVVLLLRFYYAVFLPRLPRVYWPLFAVACGLALAAWTLPRAVFYGFAGLVLLEHARVISMAVLRRLNGAWIMGLGGVLWVGGATIQMLGDSGVIPLLPDAYLYGFLGLLGSISVYLARDIARDKNALARKLVEIEELSAKERQAMERYRTMFETTGTGTILFGDDAVISLANDEWATLTGYSRHEIEGRMTWMAFFSDSSLEKMRGYHRLRSTDPSAAPRTYEAQLCDRRGKLHDGVVTIAMVAGTRERVGSFLDLSDLKRAQQQMIRADKMAALGQVIAGVAHEINNPNNFIHFNLPILRKYVEAMRPLLEHHLEQDPDLRLLEMRYDAFLDDLYKLIDNMEHGSQRITAIVSELKGYIRGGEEAEMKPDSIAKVIERVMALVGKQVRKMVKRFDVTVAERLPPVRMNAGRIEQVLINLVINAGQAADKDTSFVTLTARAAAKGDAIEILVEDNGMGIPPQSLDQIFDPFFTSKGRDTGTGLGLSISQQIVEEHGGRIAVTSEPGQGSCFTVCLPAAPPD
jgi:PAS domain S-box-containing protein